MATQATMTKKMKLLPLVLNLLLGRFLPGNAFRATLSPPRRTVAANNYYASRSTNNGLHSTRRVLLMASNKNNNDDNIIDDDTLMTDEELLETVPSSQFQDLCRQLDLSTEGTNEELLLRLRNHANEQAELEKQRRKDLNVRIEEGSNNDERERHEIVGNPNYFQMEEDDEGDEEDEGYFYFELPADPKEEKKKEKDAVAVNDQDQSEKKRPFITQNDVLAPPPPPPSEATYDDEGNRVVTVYSSTDQNDLTGVAAAQPGQAALSATDPMAAGSALNGPQPWDLEPEKMSKSATPSELESAKEKVTELVQTLLAMSGAPAFRHFDMPEELEDLDDSSFQDYSYTAAKSPDSKIQVGFDPSQIPSHLLEEASQSLRANRGQVLQEVLRKFEIHGIGQDGMNGDNLEDGGGHFKEVSKVRAFLEGYRRAQVRKAARVTVSFLLDKLVSEGVDGLDLSLGSMSRSSDDSTSVNDEFELNDSLISYLNDLIREQEKKVDQLVATRNEGGNNENEGAIQQAHFDPLETLWNQTTGEKGETIATIDPNDPMVNQILKEEIEKEEKAAADAMAMELKKVIPETAPEKMLLLLTLLRERIKIEATYGGDAQSRNLRLLAYCLQCNSDEDREKLIMQSLGASIDRFDSFMELVASSIEYAESTSHKLQPGTRMPLNVPLLQRIHDLTENIRDTQAWKASGLRP